MPNGHVRVVVSLQSFRQDNVQQDIELVVAAARLANHVFPLMVFEINMSVLVILDMS
jgi:hypothetical protein